MTAPISPDGLPSYDSLRRHGRPAGSSWGVFGDDDELGTLNFIGDRQVAYAAGSVRTGTVFPLNWRADLPDPPILGRGATRHTVVSGANGTNDDWYDQMYPQRSSQWDALAHVRHPRFGYYNAFSERDVLSEDPARLGIQNAAQQGIVGRFVLLDLAAARSPEPLTDAAAEGWVATTADLDAALVKQNTQTRRGDILLLRFGWTGWYSTADDAVRESIAQGGQFAAPGIAHDDTVLEWLWDRRIAAVASDTPALEAMPIEFTPQGFLHFRLIALLGYCVGELFDLDALAAECARQSRWDGLFTAAPMNAPGGIGSPANAIAVL